jgi:hypothetical protein
MPDTPRAHASFASTCVLCLYPTPVHKDGLCAKHWRDFGPPAWRQRSAPPALSKDVKHGNR